jgi:hypothetical protein
MYVYSAACYILSDEKTNKCYVAKEILALFMETDGSLPCSQQPATHHILSQMNRAHDAVPCRSSVCFNIIVPYSVKFLKLFLPSDFRTAILYTSLVIFRSCLYVNSLQLLDTEC